jgi:hypothetical protein
MATIVKQHSAKAPVAAAAAAARHDCSGLNFLNL